MKAWAGRFDQVTEAAVEAYTSSIHFDKRLATVDIIGSLAHLISLQETKLLSNSDTRQLGSALKKLLDDLSQLQISQKYEDIHMHIEHWLYQNVGEIAGKLHTGRSRNDQVALDMRLYLRGETLTTLTLLLDLQDTLLKLAQSNIDYVMPGYTHLQMAQPIRLSQHLLAYVAMLQRDVERFIDGWKQLNLSPLGAGAIAGSSLPIDRNIVAELLAFEGIHLNSMDAVSDRDFIATYNFNAALVMMHLSRFSEEIILWATREFSFIEISDAFCTGSSMLPQKKNPDVAEITRGKTGRVYGSLMQILTLLKGLPLSYNRDLQEDKENLFDTVDTLNSVVRVFAQMLENTNFNKEVMYDAANDSSMAAVDLANFLVKRGMPFREAHTVVGKLVKYALDKHCQLNELPLNVLQTFSNLFDASVFELFELQNRVDNYNTLGSTSKQQVELQLEIFQAQAKKWYLWLEEKRDQIASAEKQLLEKFE